MIWLDKIKAFFKYWVYWPEAKAAEKKAAEPPETKGEAPGNKRDESSSK